MRAILRNIVLQLFGALKRPRPGVHIINSHFVTPHAHEINRDTEIFESYLKYLHGFARFINLEEATERIEKKQIPEDEVLIAFTFDDGFEECYTVIAPLLEKYGVRGAFFINSNYIESSTAYQQEFNKRIATYTKKPMNWQQVIDLHQRGHLIGSHNLDHSNFAELDGKEIERQLSENKKTLEDKLKYSCDYFAWTYGQLQHFPKSALETTQKYHKYIYSGTDYKNYFSYNGQVFNRRHQESFWPKNHIRYFLSVNKKYNNNQ
ncbi:MAG: polysaccharide deacetylase family protein [Bacteroidetes bacterium]|nr:polysaccharide deacetylase family protein [Bacteroidota bacterium]